MSDETAAVFAWISKFMATIEDGAVDPEEAIEVLESLAAICDRLKTCLSRRWWRWICSAVCLALREGAEEIRRKWKEKDES